MFCSSFSHNTKTTTWLDPRLAMKAKPPEKCEEGGETTSADSLHTLESALTRQGGASRREEDEQLSASDHHQKPYWLGLPVPSTDYTSRRSFWTHAKRVQRLLEGNFLGLAVRKGVFCAAHVVLCSSRSLQRREVCSNCSPHPPHAIPPP